MPKYGMSCMRVVPCDAVLSPRRYSLVGHLLQGNDHKHLLHSEQQKQVSSLVHLGQRATPAGLCSSTSCSAWPSADARVLQDSSSWSKKAK